MAQAAAAFLIDTNIISELSRKQPDVGVVAFMAEAPRLLVSAMLFHELGYGVDTAPADRKAEYAAFLAAMRERFGARAIPVTVAIAETAGQLRASDKLKGRVLTVTDSLIAATAIVSGAHLVTRNVRDFDGVDVRVVNPFRS
jgi:toxin FitB